MSAGIAGACDPEPGPQHFPPPEVPPLPRGSFDVHSSNNGFPSNAIRALALAGNRLLVGTEGDGLILFADGVPYVFNSLNASTALPVPTVTAFAVSEDGGTAWAGTPAGLVEIQGLDTGMPRLSRRGGGDSRPEVVLAVARDPLFEGALWLGTARGAARMTGMMLTPIGSREPRMVPGLNAVAPRHDGGAWFGGSDGLHWTSGGALERVPPPEDGDGWVQCLLPVGEQLYYGSSRGLFRLDGGNSCPLLPGVWVSALANTPEVTDFLGTATATSLFAPVGAASGTGGAGDPVLQELQARANALSAQHFEMMTNFDPQDPRWESYFADLAALQADVATYTSARLERALVRGLWIGTQNQGVVLLGDDGTRYHLTSSNTRLPSNRITALAVAPNGEAWIGTHDAGLVHYRAQTVPSAGDRPVLLWRGEATVLRVIDQQLYIGTRDSGLVKCDPEPGSPAEIIDQTRVKHFHRRVTGIETDRHGRLWVSGDRGVFCCDRKRWHRYTREHGLPAAVIGVLEVDAEGRVYVAGGTDPEISAQLSQFTGDGFANYARSSLANIMRLPSASMTAYLRALGMSGAYRRQFAAGQASAALAAWDDTAGTARVVGLVGTPHYLLIGDHLGGLTMFDGAAFRRLSEKGTGKLDRLVGMRRTASGRLVIAGPNRVLTFDGQHYRPAPPITGDQSGENTDVALDDQNPETFWVSYSVNASGGVALYQEPLWQVTPLDNPVTRLAVADPYIFFATRDGVYRLVKR